MGAQVTCSLCGQALSPASPSPYRAVLVEYDAAVERWSETHRAAIWDGSKQPEHAASCKRLRAATEALRALAKEAT